MTREDNARIERLARGLDKWPEELPTIHMPSSMDGCRWAEWETGEIVVMRGSEVICDKREWRECRQHLGLESPLVKPDQPAECRKREVVDILLDAMTEWPGNGGINPAPLHCGDEGDITWRNVSDEHSWYAYRESDGACCFWPEWYSAGKAEGLPVVAPKPVFAAIKPKSLADEICNEITDPDKVQWRDGLLMIDFVNAAKDSSHHYHALADVLLRAYQQAAFGKGHERHAQDLPFGEQPMQQISRLAGSHDGLVYQSIKKIQESQRLDHDAAMRELLGAIVYTAGNIIYQEGEVS